MVYIIFDNCPSDFGEPSILAVYSNKMDAQKFIDSKREEDDYVYQYLTIVRMKVRIK
jgi:hypothetical protein